MVTHVEIKGFDDFSKYTESIGEADPPVYFFFSGEKLPGGNSWCPDCVEGINKFTLSYLSEVSTLYLK